MHHRFWFYFCFLCLSSCSIESNEFCTEQVEKWESNTCILQIYKIKFSSMRFLNAEHSTHIAIPPRYIAHFRHSKRLFLNTICIILASVLWIKFPFSCRLPYFFLIKLIYIIDMYILVIASQADSSNWKSTGNCLAPSRSSKPEPSTFSPSHFG